MTEHSRAAVLVAPRAIEIDEFPLPDIGPDEGLLRIEMAGVCGTDATYYRGKVPLPYPLILGHEILGRIARIGPAATAAYGVREGDRVVVESSIRCNRCLQCITGRYAFCENRRAYGTAVSCAVPPHLWGGFADFLYLAPGSLVYRVADDLPAEAAVQICAEIANGHRWVRVVGGLVSGDVVVIQGVGQQGLAGIIAAREAGASQIIAVGLSRDQERFRLAREFGAGHVVDADRESVVDRVRELTGGRLADLVLEVTGSPAAIAVAPNLVRKRGTVVLAGVTGKETVTPLLADKLVYNEIRLQGVYTHDIESVIPALRLVESRRYAVERMVTDHFPLERTEEAIRLVAGEEPGRYPVKVVVVPSNRLRAVARPTQAERG